MQKTITLFILALFGSSVFTISEYFVNANTPTHYIVTGGCCVLAFLVILQWNKQKPVSLSVTESLIGGFLLFSSLYGAYSGSLNQEWIITGVSLGLFYLVVKTINISIEWLFVGLFVIGIAQAFYGLGQYVHWFSNIAALGFRMSGSFDNPAGFAVALSVCFPFSLFLLEDTWQLIGSVIYSGCGLVAVACRGYCHYHYEWNLGGNGIQSKVVNELEQSHQNSGKRTTDHYSIGGVVFSEKRLCQWAIINLAMFIPHDSR